MKDERKELGALSVSILGDSISTYEGYNPIGYAVYYQDEILKLHGLSDVSETWWMQVINGLGGKLCANNSYSGSFVYETCEFSMSTEGRCRALHADGEPDLILIYAGINDCFGGITPDDFYESYCKMLQRIRDRYPHAEIACATLLLGGDVNITMKEKDCLKLLPFNEGIRKAVKEARVRLIDLAKYNKYYLSLDGTHPTKDGHRFLAELWLGELKKILPFVFSDNVE